jgi:hypothetical protein
MGFGINGNFVYTLYINKSHYEKDKQDRSCITGDNLCTDRRQHLPRWLFLPRTSKSARRNCKQELLKQEKGNCLPQRIAKSVTEPLLKEGKAWVCKRLGLFLCPSVYDDPDHINNVWLKNILNIYRIYEETIVPC